MVKMLIFDRLMVDGANQAALRSNEATIEASSEHRVLLAGLGGAFAASKASFGCWGEKIQGNRPLGEIFLCIRNPPTTEGNVPTTPCAQMATRVGRKPLKYSIQI